MVLIDNVKNVNQKETRTITKAESALDNEGFDYEIINDGTISELIDKIRNILIENKLIKNN